MGVWKSRKPESGVRAGMGTRTGTGKGDGTGTGTVMRMRTDSRKGTSLALIYI